jgi:multidrug efflux pump subunit AcrB
MVDWFVSRPVATTLLTISLCLFGIMDYVLFPITDMPNIDFPVIQMWALQHGEHRSRSHAQSRSFSKALSVSLLAFRR